MKHVIQSTLAKLRAAEWVPLTTARVLTGVFFCISGGTKLLASSHFTELQENMLQSHIPFLNSLSQLHPFATSRRMAAKSRSLYGTPCLACHNGWTTMPSSSTPRERRRIES